VSSAPRVSVVISVLRPDPVYFRQTVESVLAQTLTDFELIIIEEAPDPPDPTAPLGKDILADLEDDRIRHFLHPERTTLVQQRNRGLEAARGDLVALIDADDLCRPDRLALQVEFLDAHPEIDVLGSRLTIIDAEGEPVGERRYPTSHEEILRAFPRFNPIAQPAVMHRRRPLLEAGGYRYDRYPATEDYELWSRLARRGVRFANHPEPLVRYRIHPGGMKSARLKGLLRGTLEVKAMHWKHAGLRARLRRLAERGLLLLPADWIYRLFVTTHYRR
jgi:glycosyltransferase involved in cell wall biosynthesis